MRISEQFIKDCHIIHGDYVMFDPKGDTLKNLSKTELARLNQKMVEDAYRRLLTFYRLEDNHENRLKIYTMLKQNGENKMNRGVNDEAKNS